MLGMRGFADPRKTLPQSTGKHRMGKRAKSRQANLRSRKRVRAEPHILVSLSELDHKSLARLADEYPVLWRFVDGSIRTVEQLVWTVTLISKTTRAENLRVVLWQQVTLYLLESLRYFARGELDLGYHVFRSATELTRDI